MNCLRVNQRVNVDFKAHLLDHLINNYSMYFLHISCFEMSQ